MGSPTMPSTSVPIRPVPAMSHRSARRCIARLCCSCSPMLSGPPAAAVVGKVMSLPVPGEIHLQLNRKHRDQHSVNKDLKCDEPPLTSAVLVVHAISSLNLLKSLVVPQNVPMLPSIQ